MTTKIIVQLRIEGLHRWSKASGNVSFLAFMHRHIFHIRCEKTVTHDDRQIEIIEFKHLIEQYIYQHFFSIECNMINFRNMSCEMIAKNLLQFFKLDSCEVLEDGENGAVVYNT